MCISPIRIRNPNFGCQDKGLGSLKDCVSAYINIPCGHCSECVAVRQMGIIQRVQMEEKKNHIFFATLTYNDVSMPYAETSNGHSIRFADVADVQKMHKRLRKSNAFGRPFRFFAVSELGSQRGRPHFHILYFIPKYPKDDYNTCIMLEKRMFDAVLHEWRRNYGSHKKPDYRPLCTYVRRMVRGRIRTNYDLHYVNPVLTDGGSADVGFYVTKYMMKPSDRAKALQSALHLNLPEDEYYRVWNLVKPRWFSSLQFGLPDDPDVKDYLQKCVSKSKAHSNYALYLNPVTGQAFPLSKYYKRFSDIYSIQDHLDFFYNDPTARADNVVFDEHTETQRYNKEYKLKNQQKIIADNDRSEIFEDVL